MRRRRAFQPHGAGDAPAEPLVVVARRRATERRAERLLELFLPHRAELREPPLVVRRHEPSEARGARLGVQVGRRGGIVGGGCVAGAAAVAPRERDPPRRAVRRPRSRAPRSTRRGRPASLRLRERLRGRARARRLGVGGGERIRQGSVGGARGDDARLVGEDAVVLAGVGGLERGVRGGRFERLGGGQGGVDLAEHGLGLGASRRDGSGRRIVARGGVLLRAKRGVEIPRRRLRVRHARVREHRDGHATLASPCAVGRARRARGRSRGGADLRDRTFGRDEKTDNWDNCPTTTLRDRARARARVPSRARPRLANRFLRALDTGVPRRSKSAAVRRPRRAGAMCATRQISEGT